MESTVSTLRRRVNFYSLFGLFVFIPALLFGSHYLLAQAFGLTIAGWIIYGTTGISFIWSLFIALVSKELLTKNFKSIVPWFNDEKKRLAPIRSETESAHKSVQEASKAMGVSIDDTLVADEGVVNAFQAGLGNRVVVFYRGLFQKLSPRGVRGVAFHEVGHAKNGDIFLTVMVISFIQAFTFLSGLFWELAKWTAILALFDTDSDGNRKLKLDRVGAGVVGGTAASAWMAQFLTSPILMYFFFAILFWIISTIVGQMIMGLISQNREYLADATATQYGAGPDLIQAFKEMSAVKNTGTPSSNSGMVARIGISPVPASFLAVPSHPKMEKRIESIQNMLDGKDGHTAGGFMFFLLVLLTGGFLGWIFLPIYPVAYLAGVPVFFLGLLAMFSLELYSAFGYPDKASEETTVAESSTGSTIFGLLIALLIIAGMVWVLWQLPAILGTLGWVYFFYRLAVGTLLLTILKSIAPLRRLINVSVVGFSTYILFKLLFA